MTPSANNHSNPPSFEHKSPDDGSDDGGRSLDLKGKIRVLWRRKVLIMLTVGLITLTVTLLAFALPPKYVAVASVLIEAGRTNVVDSQATGEAVVEQTTDSSMLAAELRLLRSETYAREVVNELGLLSDSEFNPILRQKKGPLHVLGQRMSALRDWVPESLFIDTGLAELITSPTPLDAEDTTLPLPAPESEAYEELMQDTVANLLAGLEIKAGGSNLILIRMKSGDPKQAAQIADEISKIYVADQLEVKRGAVDEAIDWLGKRVADLRSQVLGAEGSVAEFRAKHGLVNVILSGRTPRAAGALPSDPTALRAEVASKEQRLEWIRELRSQGSSLQTINAVLPLPSIEQLQQRQQELDSQEATLRMKYGEQHREIIQLNSGRHQINFERQQVRAQIRAEISAGVQKLEGELAFAQRQVENLGPELEEPEPDEGSVTDAQAEVQLRDLERQAESARSLYVAFLNRFQEVSEQRNLLQEGATVASRAGVPVDPEFPKPFLMIFGGFTLSFMLGTALAFLTEYMDNGIRTARQIEKVLGLPTLCFVPRVDGLKQRGMLHRYLIKHPRSAYAEAVRTVKLATLDSVGANSVGADSSTPVVLVTSSLPNEGKTSLALSLAASSACSGRKAVIVDLDLRRPRQHQETDLGQASTGLVEVLEKELELDDVLCADQANSNLDILPAGRSPESPADLLCSPMMETIMAELRRRYEYVVLDSPPLLGVIDAKLAARLADAVLFVTQWEKTKEPAAKAGLANLVDRNTPPIGAVLTQVDVRRHASRGYGEAIQYYKKYETYYDN